MGYGMSYTSTGNNFGKDTRPEECSGVVFLCTAEAFVGLLYAGMCTAVMFGKVHRIQSHHAHLIFCNAVCLQYEEVEPDDVDDDEDGSGSDKDGEDVWFDDKVDCVSAFNESRLSWDPEESDHSNDEENPSVKTAAEQNEPVRCYLCCVAPLTCRNIILIFYDIYLCDHFSGGICRSVQWMPGTQISSCKYGESNVSMLSLRHGGFSADNPFCANET